MKMLHECGRVPRYGNHKKIKKGNLDVMMVKGEEMWMDKSTKKTNEQ